MAADECRGTVNVALTVLRNSGASGALVMLGVEPARARLAAIGRNTLGVRTDGTAPVTVSATGVGLACL